MKGEEVRSSWREPKASHRQRKVYVVRAIDPIWAINYVLKQTGWTYDTRENMIYVLNNLGLQVPLEPVFLVSNGKSENVHTMDAIEEKFRGYELSSSPDDWIPATNAGFKHWLDNLEQDTTYVHGNLIVVIDQQTYDAWCEEWGIAQSLIEPSTVLRITIPNKTVECVA